MAVLQMQRISICALKKDRKPILEALQRLGVVELSDPGVENSVFERADTSSAKSRFDKNSALAAQALEVLDVYAPVKASMLSSFAGRKVLTEKEYQERIQKRAETLEAATRLTALSKKLAESRAEIVKRQAQLDALEPWLGLDVSMRFSGTRTTSAFIGSFVEELTLSAVYERLAAQIPDVAAVNVDLISVTRDQTCVFVLCHKNDGQAVEDGLRAIGFIRPASPPRLVPVQRKKILLGYIADAEIAIAEAEKEIVSLSGIRADLQFMIDDMLMRSEKYEIISHLAQSKRTFLLAGFIPKRAVAAVESELSSKFDLSIEFADPGADEDVPVALHNNAFASPVEGVLASYSMPGKGEIDPTFFISLFYYVLYGLMFSDFAYGAIMTLGTAFMLKKFKNMEDGMKKFMKMFCYCGISTMFWGIVFGSYFGNVADQVATTFFNVPASALPIIPAAWFVPLNEPMRMLTFCMLLGLIHLFTGLAIKAYQFIRQGLWMDFVANVVFWYMLVGGGIVFGLSTPMISSILQISPLSSTVGTFFGWVSVAGAAGIVLTNGDSKNPAAKVGQGLYALYNVTGYLSDLLSYSRLLALGLATGVIGTVINQMGAMGGGNIIGLIMFLVVFAFGHAVNFGINALGAYVHTNRLQYVEFFGKFYEGGGRPFEPFAAHTKYYKFKEDK